MARYWLLVWLAMVMKVLGETIPHDFLCRDPDLGGQIPANMRSKARRFLLIGGGGAGLGNFLVYYPVAYYFALFTGRDIVIIDASLIGEMCNTVHCGYPMYSTMLAAYPKIFDPNPERAKSVKVWDFLRYMNGEITLDEQVLSSIGSKLQSGWYSRYNFTLACVARVTGCEEGDIMCHDRHALQRLVRGPFKAAFTEHEEKRIIGVPFNLKHGIMTLPHAYAPRLDAAIHLRTQFAHFERLVGPEDALWSAALKEQEDWLTCAGNKDGECGQALFKLLEAKIMEELPAIRGRAQARRNASRALRLRHRRLDTFGEALKGGVERNESDIEKDQYDEREDKIYVYLASDNAAAKEAFAKYLIGHANIAVMRVKNNANIVHAKNTGYLKSAGNNTGVMDLVLDWYALSLANVVFAWRKNTNFISTFAHSAQRLSGNTERSNDSAGVGHGIGSKGLSLFFKNGRPMWRTFN